MISVLSAFKLHLSLHFNMTLFDSQWIVRSRHQRLQNSNFGRSQGSANPEEHPDIHKLIGFDQVDIHALMIV